ncbi:hypothetical protein [Pelomonas sp. Root1444]|uniref:hypothetical protein n=1 Tax=Pelomonas sp. Root1444 TaxID=1736464 RepID=UPI0007031726|nr:hypothetical protein [Pelomonas sp. Root1444]KQY85964.1 hypothetical protein ASD35_20225 [Pelomonas sp. Root1444]
MNNGSRIHLFWQQWERALRIIFETRGAQLDFPPMQEKQNGKTPHLRVLELAKPICILNAPQKASMQRRLKRMHILIGGSFFIEDQGDHPCLIDAKCNITLFQPTENDDGTVTLELVDALHFDVEAHDANGKHKRFHPFFHVQRGLSHSDEAVRQAIADAEGRDQADYVVDQTAQKTIGVPHLRVPTPQLDIFAVLTMVAADCFCNGGDAERDEKARQRNAPPAAQTNVEALFANLLQLLTKTSNVVREGRTSVALRDRVTGGSLMSAAQWYPEWASA